jgi:mono/diheme cytochrome c family protein
MRALYVIAAGVAVLLWASAGFGQDLPAAPFTAAQADAGRQAYVQHCMMCHGAKLQGIGDAQKLVGQDFVDAWGHDTTKDLFSAVRVEMPQNNPASLSDEMYLNLVAFLLHANGASAGTVPLTAGTAVGIAGIINGGPSADVAAGLKSAK